MRRDRLIMAIIWAAVGIAFIVGWRSATGLILGIVWLLGAVVWVLRGRPGTSERRDL